MIDKTITATAAQAYAEKYSHPEDAISAALNAYTMANVSGAHMISGHLQGDFLKMLSMMLQPNNVLEIGTYTGYATIALCAGLKSNGRVYTIDTDAQLVAIRNEYWDKANLTSKIEPLIGKALDILPTLKHIPFDLAFVDADKGNNINYINYLLEIMPVGGVILVDNTLFHGEVFQEPIEKNIAQKIHQFNEYLQTLENIFHVLLPIRDGMTMIRKMK